MNYKPFFAGEMAATLCFLPRTVFERNESAPPDDDPATFCPVRRVSIQGVKSLWVITSFFRGWTSGTLTGGK